MKPKRILITGLPGSGKTHLHEYLLSKGINSVDADQRFLSYNGKRLPRGAGMTWLVRNHPRWDRHAFEAMLDSNRDRDLYVVGVAPNMLRYLDKFDKVYFLNADRETLRYRLNQPRENAYGSTKFQRELAIHMVPVAVAASKIAGFEFLDAKQKPEEIFARIQSGESKHESRIQQERKKYKNQDGNSLNLS